MLTIAVMSFIFSAIVFIVFILHLAWPKCPCCKRCITKVFAPQFGEEGSGHYYYCKTCNYFPGLQEPPKDLNREYPLPLGDPIGMSPVLLLVASVTLFGLGIFCITG